MTRSDEHKSVQDEDDPEAKLSKETIEDLTPEDDEAEQLKAGVRDSERVTCTCNCA